MALISDVPSYLLTLQVELRNTEKRKFQLGNEN